MVGVVDSILDKPSPETVEFTLLGGANGYGESVVLHIGENKWVVIDSCVDELGNSMPLMYLKNIGVSIEDIVCIVCTHWHADHIQGLFDLLNECSPKKTKFYVTLAEEKTTLIAEFIKNNFLEPNKSNYYEIVKVMELAASKHMQVRHVCQDTMIINEKTCIGYALSPSHEVINLFLEEQIFDTLKTTKNVVQKKCLSEMKATDVVSDEDIMAEVFAGYDVDTSSVDKKGELKNLYREKKRNMYDSNYCSVALLLNVCGHCLILGADLESGKTNPKIGWKSVMTDAECMHGVIADAYKIPHHGSKTGYLKEFIEKHIQPNCLAKMSTWTGLNYVLPQEDMIARYAELTNNLYLTSHPKLSSSIDAPSKQIKKLMVSSAEKIQDIPSSIGIVRSRLKINEDPSNQYWDTNCFGAAYKIHGV